jgi:hypothetical protein
MRPGSGTRDVRGPVSGHVSLTSLDGGAYAQVDSLVTGTQTLRVVRYNGRRVLPTGTAGAHVPCQLRYTAQVSQDRTRRRQRRPECLRNLRRLGRDRVHVRQNRHPQLVRPRLDLMRAPLVLADRGQWMQRPEHLPQRVRLKAAGRDRGPVDGGRGHHRYPQH